jgi:hypothetical protein
MNMKRNGKGNSKTPALSGLRLMPRCTSTAGDGINNAFPVPAFSAVTELRYF